MQIGRCSGGQLKRTERTERTAKQIGSSSSSKWSWRAIRHGSKVRAVLEFLLRQRTSNAATGKQAPARLRVRYMRMYTRRRGGGRMSQGGALSVSLANTT